jgi:hypothetical protein
MSWTAIWLDGVEIQVQRLYLQARESGHANEFTAAVAAIKRLLETDPMQAGESRSDHQRILVESPLTIDFEVYPEQHTIVVTRARYTPMR